VHENEGAHDAELNPHIGHWALFRSWHGEASFWREVYVRMIAALGAAGVIYVIAALAGLVTMTPLAVVGILMVAGTTPFLVYWWVDMIAHWKDLRMGHDWSLTPPRDDAERRIRTVYTRALPVELIWVIGCALIIAMVMIR